MPKPLEVEFGGITADNVEQLRKINTACFPVSYNDSFYNDVVARDNEGLNKFAYYNGFVVGAICTRIEQFPDSDRCRLYIMTLGVLAAYRGRGIGKQLVQSVIDYYQENRKDELLAKVDEIALHVHIHNADAIRFYTTKLDFVQGEMVENYYRRIDPPHCYILSKKLQ